MPQLGAPLCPVKFMSMKSEAHFTGVAPADGTGVEFHGLFHWGPAMWNLPK